MANLSITNKCNKKCAYCFAGDTRNEYGTAFMDLTVYDKALAYLKRSGINQVRLLGGEPTLHPEFTGFVEKALGNDFNLMLFTNGLIRNDILEFLNTIPEEKITVLLNTIHPSEKNPRGGLAMQKKTMEMLGERVIAGVNIYSDHQDLFYILDYISEYHLKKEIRLGIAHPVLSRNNMYLHPKDYKRIGYKIAVFKRECAKNDVSLGFDCGFVPCMFPPEQLENLGTELKKAGTCCHPIIDLLSDGTFISCYPLNNFRKIPIDDDIVAGKLIETFDDFLNPYKHSGIYAICTSCPLFRNRCNGGCMSFRIRRFRN
jgi:MoaA/NifB/PqqE/SkfB family radical SAM enzyme